MLHSHPIAPDGLDPTMYLLALDEKVLQQQQERTTIAVVASRLGTISGNCQLVAINRCN